MSQTNNTKQAAWVAIGSLCSFGFSIVSSMILSRYFNKSDYGTYKQVMYVYNTLLMVFSLGLPKAYSFFLPRVALKQSKDLIHKITRLFFILGGVFSLFLFIFAPEIARILNNVALVKALRVFAIVPFLLLPTMGLDGILATFKQTKFIAVYNIITNIFKLLCVSIPVMLWNLGYVEALVGFVIASVVTFLLALYLQHYPVRDVSEEKCSVTYKEIFNFSIPLLVASLWGVVISSSDQFFVSRYFGPEVFADFSNGSIELPFIGMVTGACATVLSPLFSRMSHEKLNPKTEIYPLWMSVFEKTAKLIYPLVTYCLFFADTIMVVLYGEKYSVSDNYFRIKLLTNFFTLIAYGPLVINIGKVKYYSNVHMITAILVVVLEYFSILTINSPLTISWVSMICHVGKIIAMLWLVATFFEVRLVQLFPIKLIFQIITPSIILLFLERWFFLDYLNFNQLALLITSFALYIILFLGYSWVVKMDYKNIFIPLISKK